MEGTPIIGRFPLETLVKIRTFLISLWLTCAAMLPVVAKTSSASQTGSAQLKADQRADKAARRQLKEDRQAHADPATIAADKRAVAAADRKVRGDKAEVKHAKKRNKAAAKPSKKPAKKQVKQAKKAKKKARKAAHKPAHQRAASQPSV